MEKDFFYLFKFGNLKVRLQSVASDPKKSVASGAFLLGQSPANFKLKNHDRKPPMRDRGR